MADKKISALTAASTPLAGTEVLPIVQSGATVKVAVSDLTAGRAVSASQLSSTTKVSAKIATSGTYYRVYEILATGGTAIGEISYSDTNDTMRIANLSNYVNTSMTFYNNGSDRMEIMPNGDVKALNSNFVIGTSGKGIDFSATSGSGTSELLADYEEGTWTPTQGAGLVVVGTFSSTGTYTKVGRQVTVTGRLAGSTSIACTAGGVFTSGLPFAPVATNAGAATSSNLAGTVLYVDTTIYSTSAMGASAALLMTATYFV
jgi:hypothetical protein